jgi:hypothetical protein
MTLPAYYILIFFLVGMIGPLLGVALGGILVFRTKREGHESLFPGKEKSGEAFNIEEEWEKNVAEATEQVIPEVTKRAGDRFRDQLASEEPKIAETLGKEEEKE